VKPPHNQRVNKREKREYKMGSTVTAGLINSIDEGLCDLDQALIIHLRSNNYPPLPYCLVETCKEVIAACNDGDLSRDIDLPGGITFHDRHYAPAADCARAWHLDQFIEYLEE
jgi:hypothetical protein